MLLRFRLSYTRSIYSLLLLCREEATLAPLRLPDRLRTSTHDKCRTMSHSLRRHRLIRPGPKHITLTTRLGNKGRTSQPRQQSLTRSIDQSIASDTSRQCSLASPDLALTMFCCCSKERRGKYCVVAKKRKQRFLCLILCKTWLVRVVAAENQRDGAWSCGPQPGLVQSSLMVFDKQRGGRREREREEKNERRLELISL